MKKQVYLKNKTVFRTGDYEKQWGSAAFYCVYVFHRYLVLIVLACTLPGVILVPGQAGSHSLFLFQVGNMIYMGIAALGRFDIILSMNH